MKFAFLAAIYYWLVKLLYKFCATYIGWYYPGFMRGWYNVSHNLIGGIPQYGPSLDNLIRDNFADGDLVFWEIWFGLGLIIAVWRGMQDDMSSANPVQVKGR